MTVVVNHRHPWRTILVTKGFGKPCTFKDLQELSASGNICMMKELVFSDVNFLENDAL